MEKLINKVESLQMNLDIEVTVTHNIIEDVGAIIHQSQRVAYTAVDIVLLRRNWLIGKRIYEEELKESRKENYGLEIINNLSKELVKRYGKGFSKRNLYHFYRFYKLYKNIFEIKSRQSFGDNNINNDNILPSVLAQSIGNKKDEDQISPSRGAFGPRPFFVPEALRA